MILDYCVIGHIAPTTPKIVDYDNGSSVALAIIVRSVRSAKCRSPRNHLVRFRGLFQDVRHELCRRFGFIQTMYWHHSGEPA